MTRSGPIKCGVRNAEFRVAGRRGARGERSKIDGGRGAGILACGFTGLSSPVFLGSSSGTWNWRLESRLYPPTRMSGTPCVRACQPQVGNAQAIRLRSHQARADVRQDSSTASSVIPPVSVLFISNFPNRRRNGQKQQPYNEQAAQHRPKICGNLRPEKRCNRKPKDEDHHYRCYNAHGRPSRKVRTGARCFHGAHSANDPKAEPSRICGWAQRGSSR